MIEYYIGYILLVIAHELGHFVLLKTFNVGVIRITSGNIFFLRVGNINISPLVISGKTIFSNVDFERLKLIPKLLIIVAGPFSNAVIGIALSNSSLILSTISYFMALVALLPIPFLNTDGWCIIRELYEYLIRRRQRE